MADILMPEHKLSAAEIDRQLDVLADCYRSTSGPGMRFLTRIGTRADQLLMRLPEPMRRNLDMATEQALTFALRHSGRGRRILPRVSPRAERIIGATLGAVGGAGGVVGTLAEVPLSTTFLLRIIQDEAARNGFDPNAESVRFDTVRVFAAPGPFAESHPEFGYLATRLALHGGGLQRLLAQVAPKLGVALGQKIAAQAVPVLGGAAGASCNYLYADYYQKIAKVHFNLRRLALRCDTSEEELVRRLRSLVDDDVR